MRDEGIALEYIDLAALPENVSAVELIASVLAELASPHSASLDTRGSRAVANRRRKRGTAVKKASTGDQQDVLLFLDSCQVLLDDASFWDAVRSMIQSSPRTTRWAFSSNARLPISKIELISLGPVRELSSRDLELSVNEQAKLLAACAGSRSLDEIAGLSSWPALIAMTSFGESASSVSGLRSDVEAYVRITATRALSASEREILTELSCLADIPARLANFMLERDDCFKLLHEIEIRTGLLRVSNQGSPSAALFSMLTPVRKALLLQFELLGESRGKCLRRRAADWYVQADMPDRGVEQLLACGDFDVVSAILEKHGLEYCFRFGIERHGQVLLSLPATLRNSLPRLRLSWIHVMARSGNSDAARVAYEQLRESTNDFWCDREGAVPGKLFTEAKLVDLTIAAWCGTIVSLEQLYATDAFFRSSRRFTLLELRYANRFLTAICFQRGDFIRAQTFNQKGHEIDTTEIQWIRQFWPEMYAALLCVERCRIDEALVHFAAAKAVLDQADRQGTTEAMWYGAARAELDYEQNRLGSSDGATPITDNFERALCSATTTGGVFDVWAAGYVTLASARFCATGLERSLDVLLKAQEFADRRGLRSLSMVLVAHRVRILFRAGLPNAAIQEAQQAQLLNRLASYPGASDLTWREYSELVLATARCELELGRWDRALEILSPAISRAAALGGSRSEAKFRLLAAVSEARASRLVQAGEHVATALRLLVQQRLLRPIIDEGRIFSSLIEEIIERPAAFNCSRATLEMAKLTSRWCSYDVQSRVGALLTAREMQVLRLLAQGGSNKIIGKELSVSEHAIKFHLKRIFSKLGVSSREEAVAEARERQLYRIRQA